MKKNKKQLDLFEDKPLVRVDINIPAVREFATDRWQALEKFSSELRTSVAEGVNEVLKAELSLFLGKPEQAGNKRNGYRSRDYYLKGIGSLRIELPRDRQGEFESVIIPAHERMDPRSRQDLAMLYLAGISNRTLAMISKRLLGTTFSKDTVGSSLGLLKESAEKWLTRPLKGQKYWALYIDGTNFKVQRRGSTEREPSLVVLGVDASNHRSILAIEPGHRDNVDSWRAVFRELKRRGLDADAVRIGIMDGLPGLENLFREEFPHSVTQRCWSHAKRNASAKVPARFREAFEPLLIKVMYASSEDDSRIAFKTLKEVMNQDAQRAVHCIEKDLDALVVHYRFEKRFWKALKTTNPIERVNKEFKRRTKTMDSVGESTLTTIVAFIALKLEMGWQIHPIDSNAIKNLKNLEPKLTMEDMENNAIEKAIDTMSGVLH